MAVSNASDESGGDPAMAVLQGCGWVLSLVRSGCRGQTEALQGIGGEEGHDLLDLCVAQREHVDAVRYECVRFLVPYISAKCDLSVCRPPNRSDPSLAGEKHLAGSRTAPDLHEIGPGHRWSLSG
jgi:hypothetical protein